MVVQLNSPNLFVFFLSEFVKFIIYSIMARGKKLSKDVRGRIRVYKDIHKSNRWISRELGISLGSINNFVKVYIVYYLYLYFKHGKIRHKKSPGHPRKLNERMIRRIVNAASNKTIGVRRFCAILCRIYLI